MATSDSTTLKHCRKCGVDKPATLEYFYVDKSKSDGLTTQCRECKSEYGKRYRAENKERIAAYIKQWVASNKDRRREISNRWYRNHKEQAQQISADYRRRNKQKEAERHSKYKIQNRLKVASADREYRRRNKERRNEYNKQYYRDNPGVARAMWDRRRAKKMKAVGTYTAEDVQEMMETQAGHCAYCGITLHGEFHVDHIMPLSRGGSNSPDNLCISCQSCNCSKHDKTPDEWQLIRGW